ncbi:MAG: GNAT family N-acetyltransferase [Ignavibacterium sp.]|nr:MAG: GNAT family N-acetyltransferase [Ignavibacterium sp.]
MNKEIIITEADVGHLDELNEIAVTTFTKTIPADVSSDDMEVYVQDRFGKEVLISAISNPETEFYIARLNGKTIGYLKINLGDAQTDINDQDGMEIERIYTLSEYFGKNVGKLLLEKAVEAAKEKNVKYVWLGVWENNPRAIRFYEKNGFVPFGNHGFKFGNDTHTDILMKLEL